MGPLVLFFLITNIVGFVRIYANLTIGLVCSGPEPVQAYTHEDFPFTNELPFPNNTLSSGLEHLPSGTRLNAAMIS